MLTLLLLVPLAATAQHAPYRVIDQTGSTITPVITASRCETSGETCAAPLAIHFSARSTTCSTSECDDSPIDNESYHALDYVWAFDDPTAAALTWIGSGQSRDVEYGPLAVHVFDDPGTYTVQLCVRSGSEGPTCTTTDIIVDDADVVWATTDTTCVNLVGDADFTGCPADANHVNSNDSGTAANTALAAGVRRILFKGGSEFAHSTSFDMDGLEGPGMIGAYGTGRAIIDAVGGAGNIFSVTEQTADCWPGCGPDQADWRVVDLEILQASTGSAAGNNIAWRTGTNGARASNWLWYRLLREDGDQAWEWSMSIDGNGLGEHGLFIVDSTIGSGGGNVNTMLVGGSNAAIVGNTLTNGSDGAGGGHVYRIMTAWRDFVLSHNYISPAGSGSSDATVRGNQNGIAQFMVYRGNYLTADCCRNGANFFPSFNGSNEGRIQDVIIEANRMDHASIVSEILIAAKTVTFRNNIMRNSHFEPAERDCSLPDGWISDLVGLHNSGFGDSSLVEPTSGLCSPSDQVPSTWAYRNNAHWRASAGVDAVELLGGETTSNNVDRDDIGATTPYQTATPTIDPADWVPSAPMPTCPNLGGVNLRDFYGALRATPTTSCGAIEAP